ncbi:MAG TPA: hypothetical protein VFY67_02395 [Pyrinomonadaceae bacterium]|nr:hypothetical protein [Pyrinomonadaceae bacterium]
MNLFASLVDRALGRAPVLQRRRPGLFEPAGNVVLPTRNNTMDLLREEQSFAEAKSSAGQETTTKVTNSPEDSRAKSQPASSNTASTVTPRATDITLVEEQPAFKPRDREAGERDDGRRTLPIREQTLMQDAPQQLSQKPAPSPAPSIETIVETKPEPKANLQAPADENPFDEVDLVADAPEQAQSSVVNNIVVLRTIAQKQNSDQIDEARLLKPVTQRRPTRQQMQRSAHARLQSEHPQLETPAQPTINVTIGRVEVRASTPAKRADAARPSAPKLSLEEYLRGRSKGN